MTSTIRRRALCMLLRPGRMTAPRWLALTSLAALASLAPAAEGRTAASPAEEPAAAAVGSGDPAAAAGDPAADMQTAIKLYEQARDRQRRGDYVGEIALLKHALAISPDAPEYAKYRGTLLYALASACHQLHDQTGDAAALSEALRWLAAYELQLADDDRASRSDIQRQRAIIEAKLQAAAAAEEVEERAAEEARAGASTVAPAPTPAAPVAAAPPTRDRCPLADRLAPVHRGRVRDRLRRRGAHHHDVGHGHRRPARPRHPGAHDPARPRPRPRR
ncbi:MAG: hypothetical protein H6713_03465 [Myxococcales bacterium]|nr:hypothetical protein [Myxococcales bacterium]